MSTIYSISEITNKIKNILEDGVGRVGIEGEVSNFKAQSSGHLYFTLKDAGAAISAVMFSRQASTVKFKIRDGMNVRVFGEITLYQPRGQCQIVVDKMELSGEGDILRMLEDRKRKLDAEGLFDNSRKKPLPAFPTKIAIITSPTGAAVQDIINVCTRRNPKIELIILPAVVQGAEAAPSLVKQLKIANLHKMADVIIIGRGGGSIEDLLPFSEEEVVRAIAHSSIPVISSVGHEIDWALSDYVADRRAATPSVAAELATPILSEVLEKIDSKKNELASAVEQRIERLKLLCSTFSPEHLEMLFQRIEQPFLLRFDDAKEELLRIMQERLKELSVRVSFFSESLKSLNPKSVLKRGYSIVRKENGEIVFSAKDVGKDDEIIIETGDGSFGAKTQ